MLKVVLVKIIHQKSGIVLGSNVRTATSFWRRLRGYMFYAKPPTEFDGLYFPNSKIVHNSFVRFSLDVIFIDRSNTVVKVIRGFRPWRISKNYRMAAHAVEFPAGSVPESVTSGDQLVFQK